MDEILCPGCGSDERLRGERHDGFVRTTCEACELTWDRDLTPRCPTCGSEDLRGLPKPVVQRSRGSQLSIVAVSVVHLCPRCDAEAWQRHKASGTAMAPDELPTDG